MGRLASAPPRTRGVRFRHYLRQAAFFVEGRGLYSLGELEPEPFTTWPLGYPLAIAGAAKLTGLSVFWAAKVIDTAAALICIVLLLYALPRTGGMASVAWLSGGIITTFSATYAEGIFILAMLVCDTGAGSSPRPGERVCGGDLGDSHRGRLLHSIRRPRAARPGTGRLSLGRRERPAARGAPPGGVPGRRGRPDRGLSVAELCDLRRPLTRGRPATRKPDGRFIYESAKALVAEVNFVFVYVPHPRHPILLAAFAAVIVLTVAVSLQMTVRGRGAGRGLGRLDSGEPRDDRGAGSHRGVLLG